ncbi:hypothetical protein AAFF_G00043590 [Aldrovandia affinis]|uniref:Uncharacterized protein n=1 Tax=Aldrovandia affinis TaxID=143900 RepID=A0AAD7R283_9TELE|nr:hypothetical protein AAFF_G00043590 [Aldrovandia affinis]
MAPSLQNQVQTAMAAGSVCCGGGGVRRNLSTNHHPPAFPLLHHLSPRAPAILGTFPPPGPTHQGAMDTGPSPQSRS